MNKNIFINISDIASYIGQNKWNYTEAFERLWKKCDSNYNICLNELKNIVIKKNNELLIINNQKTVLELQLSNKLITKRQFNNEVKKVELKKIEKVEELNTIENKVNNITLTQTQKIEKEIGKEITDIIASTITDTRDKRKIVNESIKLLEKNGKIKNEQKIEMLKQTESLINKTHGTLTEQSAIDIFEKKYKCQLDITQQYYKSLIMSTNNINWYIGGKLDGIHDDYIVEVKNRTKGFFSYLRDYENTQIQLYLMLTNYQNAKLVEKYNNSIKITNIERDQLYIDQILDYLKIFIKNMEIFIDNTELKIKYLHLIDESDKQKFLDKLYISEIIKTQQSYIQQDRLHEDTVCLIDDDDDF